MAITKAFTVSNTVVTMNGRSIEDWGQQDPPFQDDPVDPKRTVVRGQGGNAVVLERKNPGRRIMLYLLPGSADSAYLHGLYLSGDIVTVTRNQVGVVNSAIGTEGVVVQEESVTRGGSTSISDDVYVIDMNDWTEIR